MIARTSKLEAILETAVAAIITIDERGIIESVNPATERLFGYAADELIGCNASVLMPEPYRSEHDGYLDSYRKTGRRKIIGIGREVWGQRKDGTSFSIDLAVSEFWAEGQRFFAGIILDLSERKRVEEALRESERRLAQTQRLDAIGQLTGGVAHDFNNLLTVITGNLELLEMRIESPEQRELLKEAQEAVDLGARLTDRLLTFARRRHLDTATLRLNEIVLGATSLLRRTLGEQISLSTVLSAGLWPARSDAAQIESAIVNLALNSRDSMPTGGKLSIETRNVSLEPDNVEVGTEFVAGDYVVISVSDTGSGMPPDVKARAFEPFFTTKQRGSGTGLGLSMVYGFAKQSGGHVTIYSEVGHGTTVNLYLPRAKAEEAAEVAAEAVGTGLANGEIIMVVEDDGAVRQVTVRRLRALGYEVVECSTGRAALDAIEDGQKPDLVFSDLVMPGGVSGYDLCRRVRAIDPSIRLLLTSGYSEELAREGEGGLEDPPPLLRKPYRLGDLQKAVAEALRGSG